MQKINIYQRTIFVSIGVGALVLTAIGDSLYRPWIYSNNYFDFGLANYLPSITGTITAIFLLCGVSKSFPKNIVNSSSGVIIGCALYEVLQPILRTGVFDWQDLAAVLVTGMVVLLVFKNLLKNHRIIGVE
ncbi:hypothetical protein [Cellvibrio zantedeschiae]|uniref:hypothetical protein n=1 Tax=Cellvibrio zantedeschiae TaxID=1237077 RepID=UPI00167987EB|nr:hypothetical protein [Cellvibrio zantedeschiae]